MQCEIHSPFWIPVERSISKRNDAALQPDYALVAGATGLIGLAGGWMARSQGMAHGEVRVRRLLASPTISGCATNRRKGPCPFPHERGMLTGCLTQHPTFELPVM